MVKGNFCNFDVNTFCQNDTPCIDCMVYQEWLKNHRKISEDHFSELDQITFTSSNPKVEVFSDKWEEFYKSYCLIHCKAINPVTCNIGVCMERVNKINV
jgi:hypothetical protein